LSGTALPEVRRQLNGYGNKNLRRGRFIFMIGARGLYTFSRSMDTQCNCLIRI
jgi:hypothetical protein